MQFRVNCYVIRMIRKRSGWTYSIQNGADIDKSNEALWIEFIDGLEATYRTAANKFRNKGWPLFDKINEILPERAKGKRAYYASRRQTQPPPDPELDDGSDEDGGDAAAEGSDKEGAAGTGDGEDALDSPSVRA